MNALDEDGATPLHYAAAERDARIIRLLLEAGADRLRVDSSGQAAVGWLTGATGRSKAFWMLVGMDPPPRKDRERPPPPEPDVLEQAIRAGDLDRVASLLGGGTGETSADESSNSPIMTAVATGQPEVVEFLVNRGADVNRKDEHRWTLLTVAAECGQLQVTRTLEILLTHGPNVNPAQRPSWTPLHSAAMHGHRDIAAHLLAHGAYPHVRDEQGRTPRDLAKSGRHMAIVRMLTPQTPPPGERWRPQVPPR